MLEGGDFAEGVSRHVLQRWASRRKDIDRDKLVVDALFLQHEANRTYIDAVGRTKTIGYSLGCISCLRENKQMPRCGRFCGHSRRPTPSS